MAPIARQVLNASLALAFAGQMAAAEGAWDATVGFARDTWYDTGSVITAPLSWDRYEWGAFALGATVIGVSVATLDQSTRNDAQDDRSASSDRMAKLSNTLGTGFSLGVLGVSAGIGAITGAQRPLQLARDGLEASIITTLIVTPMKFAVGRARPDQDPDGSDDFQPLSGNLSFPSGHTTQAFAIASVVANTYRDHWWPGALAFGVAGTVGLARINDNQHYLSDVIAGALIGGSIGWMVVNLNRERRIAPGVEGQVTAGWDGDGRYLGLALRF